MTQIKLKKQLDKFNTCKKELDKLAQPGVLKQIREDKGFTLAELGSRFGVTRQYICGLEKGLYSPSMQILQKYTSI